MNSFDSKDETSPPRSIDPEVRRRRVRKRVTGTNSSDLDGEKSRRRHHRSKSPDKSTSLKQRKRQFYSVVSVFIAGFLLVLAGTFSIGYHNSGSFRGKLLADLENGSGATVSLSQLRVSPTLATVSKVEYRWDEENRGPSGVVLKNISSHYFVGGLLGGAWNGSDLSAESGKIYLKQAGSGVADDADNFDYESKYGLDRIKCGALNIYSAEGGLLIKESFAHFKWGVNPMQLQLAGGLIGVTEFGEFIVDQGYIEIQSDYYELHLQLKEKNGAGKAEVKGVIGGSNSAPLVLKVDNLPSSSVLGDSLGQLILGDWSGNNGRFTLKQEAEIGGHYDIMLKTPHLNLGRFDCFAVLANVLHKNNYRRPKFRRGGILHVTRDDAGVTLSDMSFSETRGLALRGTLLAKESGIEGELKIGIPLYEKVNLRKRFREGTFSTTSEGYLWETVLVTGKLDDLRDDLRAKLRAEGELAPVPQESPAEGAQNKAPVSQQEIEAAFDELISK